MKNCTRIALSMLMLALFSLATASSAHADEIFNLTLTASSPQPAQFGGTGTLTLSQAPAVSGNTTYTTAGSPSMALSFTIDGFTFVGSNCTAQYTNGTLNTIFGCTFGTVSGNSLSSIFASGSSGGYQALFPGDSINGGSVSGTFTIGAGTIQTPETSGLILLGTALLGMVGMVYGRKALA